MVFVAGLSWRGVPRGEPPFLRLGKVAVRAEVREQQQQQRSIVSRASGK